MKLDLGKSGLRGVEAVEAATVVVVVEAEAEAVIGIAVNSAHHTT